jgi:hypothetical protein
MIYSFLLVSLVIYISSSAFRDMLRRRFKFGLTGDAPWLITLEVWAMAADLLRKETPLACLREMYSKETLSVQLYALDVWTKYLFDLKILEKN